MDILVGLLLGSLIIIFCHVLSKEYAQKIVLEVLEDIKSDLEKEELFLLRKAYKEKE